MSVAQETPVKVSTQASPPPRRNGPWAGYSHLLMARMLELKREPEVVFWVFVFPLLLALGLGIAFRNKPADAVSVAVVSGVGAQDAQALLARSPQHELFKIQILDAQSAHKAFRLGKFDLVIEPDGKGGFAYRYDPARPESVLAKSETDDAMQAAAGRKDAVTTTTVSSSEPGSRYIDFLIPGLLGMNLMSAGMWGIGYVVVEMRTKKLLKRMVATPMSRAQFLWSFVIMRALFLVLELPVLLGFAWLVFKVGVAGSWPLLLGVSLLGALCFAGIGLLVASRAQNTQTVSGLVNLVMLPMFVASGVFFSTARFPDAAQPFLRVLPLTALNDALRAVMIDGAGMSGVWRQVLLMGAMAAVTFAAALKLFRWR